MSRISHNLIYTSAIKLKIQLASSISFQGLNKSITKAVYYFKYFNE